MVHDKECRALLLENKDCNCSATTELYYIQDRRIIIGNCMVWWRIDGHGYTSDLKEAWKVPKWKLSGFDRKTDIPHKVEDIDRIVSYHVDFQKLGLK